MDPLLYGTYLGGGSTDYLYNVCPAPDGGVYVAGDTDALSGFPTTAGAYDETGMFPGIREFVSHFGQNGQFTASTLFGEIQLSSNRNTEGGASDLVFDPLREGVWMCGKAYPDWPLTPDAIDTTIRGLYNVDAFVLRFSEDLTTLEYCSYLGGNHGEEAYAIALDSLGRIHGVGATGSLDFPVTDDAIFESLIELEMHFFWVYDPASYEVVFSTYFGWSRRLRSTQRDFTWFRWACLGGGRNKQS
ncbi:MAG: hypothetical protein IPP40_16910 [bacterium]|nr:hypothetical protein [bacterium]